MRSIQKVLAVIAVVVSLLTGCDFGISATPSRDGSSAASYISTPSYTGDKKRWEYQNQLNQSAYRISPQFEVVEYDNALWVRRDIKRGNCTIRCGVAMQRGDTYVVSLPVGFIHDSNVSPMPKDLVPISTLTYWSAEKHREVTASYDGRNRSVNLPFELEDHSGRFYIPKGETQYVAASLVYRNKGGKYFLDPQATIRSEPLGPEFGYAPDALIVRRMDNKGFEVKLPKNHNRRSQETDYMIPVRVSFADTDELVSPSRPSILRSV